MINKFFKKVKASNSEKGAIVAEASFIMPLVIVVIFVLIYLALIQIQQAIMQVYAQETAHKICNISTFAGYEMFYEEAYQKENKVLGLPEDYNPSFNTLEEVFSTHNPYRYLGGIYLDKHNNYKDELEKIIEKSMYFNKGIVETDIDVVFQNLSTAIKVKATYNFKLPKFFNMVGLNSNFSIKSEVIVYANDNAEFIRNTDLVFDLFNHFLKKYHLDDKINTFYKKIKEFSK
jgi:hypothetical protein